MSKVIGDKYAGEWPRERFREHGVQYEPAAKPKSDLYRDLLPLINSRKIELLDDQRLVTQLSSLERRTARSGRDSIDHPPGAHDDVGNSVAGVAAALAVGGGYRADISWVTRPGRRGGESENELPLCPLWSRITNDGTNEAREQCRFTTTTTFSMSAGFAAMGLRTSVCRCISLMLTDSDRPARRCSIAQGTSADRAMPKLMSGSALAPRGLPA